MRKTLFLLLLFSLAPLFTTLSQAEPVGGYPVPEDATAGRGPDVSIAYLDQARAYRDEGRYELARQSYAQALSTCRNIGNLEIIKRELAGVELLIRTMR